MIQGGRRLRGRIRVNGSKNATLALMAAALLTDEPVVLQDAPSLRDTRNMVNLLNTLGCQAALDPKRHEATLHATDPSQCLAHYDIVRTMRASICVLGPLVAKRGGARVSMPGGCNIGDRPVDLHLRALEALGATITLHEGYINAEAPPGGRLYGARVFLGGPFGSTVLGTCNLMSAAALAKGHTVIESAACEPEVADLAVMLNAMGAKITGAGTPRISIQGVDRLSGVTHRVMPDRIEAGTYIMAAAITNGDVVLENCPTDVLTATLDRIAQIGVDVEPVATETIPSSTPSHPPTEPDPMRQTVRVGSYRRLNPVQVVTQPHPGFPTDLQAQAMALLCLADGNSVITEKNLPRPVPARARAVSHGREADPQRRKRPGHGCAPAGGGAGDGQRPACLRRAGAGGAGRHRDHHRPPCLPPGPWL